MATRPAMEIRYQPDALYHAYKTVRLEDKLGEDMTDQKRRIEDKLPGHSLDWSDAQDKQPAGDLTDEQAWKIATRLFGTVQYVSSNDEYVKLFGAADAGQFARAAIAAHLASQSQAAQPAESKIADSDSARAFVDAWHREHFPTDRTFSRYIMGRNRHCALAGDFAWQLAKALESMGAAHIAGTSQATKIGCGGTGKFGDMPCLGCDACPDASQATKVQAVPDILFDGNAVYDEITRHLGRSHCFTADAISTTLDAVVRLIRRAAPTAQEVTQQAAPTAWLATDLDGRGDVAFTKEEAKRRAGEGCTEFFPLYDLADLAPTTQQAAKAETAEQAGGEQEFAPPFAAPASQHNADPYDVIDFALELAENEGNQRAMDFLTAWWWETNDDFLRVHWPAFAKLELASRCRAQGGENKPSSSAIASNAADQGEKNAT